jgi:hypothetical protein
MIELLNSIRIQIILLFGLFGYALDSFGLGLMHRPWEFCSIFGMLIVLMHLQRNLVIQDIVELIGEDPEDDE